MGNINGYMLKEAFQYAYQMLYKNKESVNALNVFPVPDGDTGTNMTLTMRSAVAQLKSMEEPTVEEVGKAISNGSIMGARGNSGVILSQILRGFAVGLEDQSEMDLNALALGFESACKIAYKAVMKPTEGTILTVIRKMAEYAADYKNNDDDMRTFMLGIIAEGNMALEDTPNMLPVLKEAGVVDAGGKGLMILVEGVYRYFTEDTEYLDHVDFQYETQNFDAQVRMQQETTGEIKFSYCTEFLIHALDNNPDIESFRNTIAPLGDCLLVVSAESIVKVHIHTNHPGKVLEEAVALGALEDIKIDNMRIQNQNIIQKQKDSVVEGIVKDDEKYSFITVSYGEGLNNIFKELGVDVIIAGGQTMNPSTEDFLKAIDEVHGEYVFLLPNNSNIIMAAEQAKSISKRNVYVVPSKTLPEGMVALLSMQKERSPEENIEVINEVLSNVKTGMVTFAVRDSVVDGKAIKKDNYIGIERGKIHSTGKNLDDVTEELIEALCDEDATLITIFYGNDLQEEKANALKDRIETKFSDCDVELVWGGQPIYYYIVSVE